MNNGNVIYVMNITHDTIVDGDGLRTSVYCSGCKHHCGNCHNPESWNIYNGKPMIVDEVYNEIVSNSLTDVTFSGGDPMLQARGFSELAKKIKQNTNKTIWCYTGYTYEEIISRNNKYMVELLKYIDMLVDGKYIDSLKTESIPFIGSSNQRIIHVKESLKQKQVVLYEE